MSRQPVLTSGFHPYAHGQNHYEGVGVVHSGLTYRAPQPQPQPLPMRPPQLASAYNTHGQSTHGHHQHPLPHPHTHTHHHHQQQQHQRPHQQPHSGHGHGHHGARNPTVSMSAPAYMPSDEELAHLQKLSNDYEPEATGPLVGERQSSSAITSEYANADPIYRIKTAALPAKYAYFRTCRGDGHCGWRAIAFTYFEALLRVAEVTKIEDEEARLASMHNLLNLAGFSPDVYIDWAEEVFDLLHKLADSLRIMDGNAPDILLQTFNDMSTSMAIITYFKLLASAWVQSHADEFRHFLPMDVKTYCSLNIEAAVCEIDNVAIAALSDAIIKPAGIGFEIMYLDRSAGEEVNVTAFSQPTDHSGMLLPNPPMIRLLYRPGHYDILYKGEDFPAPIQHAQPVSTQPPLHVALANYTDGFMPVASNVDGLMTMIPGMYSTGLGQRWPSVSYDFETSPAPPTQITPVQPYAPTPAPPPSVTTSHPEFMSPVHSNHMNHHNPPSHHNHSIQLEQPPVTLPIHPPPPPVSIERAPLTIERGGPFRPSIYELEPGFGSGQAHTLPFQTSIFRNSHYNTAHFLNPDFQPEEWSPDTEYNTGNKGRHKSTSQ